MMNHFAMIAMGVAFLIGAAAPKRVKTGTPPAVPVAKENLRILSYNIHNAIGMDGVVDYGRIAAVLQKVQPQVVALQELDSVTERSKGVDVLQELAAKTGMYATYGAAIAYKGGKYGVGVLSREAPLAYSSIPLPGREEQRVLLMVEFKDYVLFCTHLSLTKADREASLLFINDQKNKFAKKVFLAGDLNDTPASAAIATLKSEWVPLSGETATFPAQKPAKCIDYIWGARPYRYRVVRKEVLNEPMASDHLPLYVEVKQ